MSIHFKIAVALIILILIPSQLFAQQQAIGMDLLRGCTSIVKQAEGKELTGEEMADAFFWLGLMNQQH